MPRRLISLLALVPLLAPIAAFAVATLTASPSSIGFATRCVRSAAATRSVRITNDGDPEARNVSVAVSPTGYSHVFPLSGETARGTLSPDGSLSFKVGFVPDIAGVSSAKAVVSYDAVITPSPKKSGGGGGPPDESPSPSPSPSESLSPKTTTVPLSGSGIDRWVDASPKAVNFGSLRVGRAAPSKTVRIYDDGDTPLRVTSIALAGKNPGDFTLGSAGPVTVTDQSPFTVTVGFTPRAVGARSAELVIESDSCDGATVRVSLAGVGVLPDVIAIPHRVAFGSVRLGKVAREFVTVANQGGLDLRVSSVRVAGRAPSPLPVPSARDGEAVPSPTPHVAGTVDVRSFFIKDPPPRLPRTLAPGESFDLVVVFKPRADGPVEAVLEIRSDDRDSRVFEVSLEGEGNEVALSPSPSPSISPTPEPPVSGGGGAGFELPIGRFVPEIAVAGAVAAFFVFLVVVRRVRGVPE